MLDRGGHFSLQQVGDARKKFNSNNRLQGTPEENAAAVAGSLAFFGTYTVEDNVITFHIERSSYPNWDGIVQKRPFTLTGDELKWEVRGNTSGGSGEVVFKRAN